MVRSSLLDKDMRTHGDGGPDLTGVRVLVAEDEAIVAFDLEETLRSLGCSVRAAVSSGSSLLELVRQERPDMVLLDLGLADGFAGPIAASLRAEGVPFVLTTGYPPGQFDEPALRGAPVVVKPYDARELAWTLARVTGR